MPMARVPTRLARATITTASSQQPSVSTSTKSQQIPARDASDVVPVQKRSHLETDSFINVDHKQSDYASTSKQAKLETDNKCPSVIAKVSSSSRLEHLAKEKLLKVVEETIGASGSMDDQQRGGVAGSDDVDDNLNAAHEGLRNIIRIAGLPVG